MGPNAATDAVPTIVSGVASTRSASDRPLTVEGSEWCAPSQSSACGPESGPVPNRSAKKVCDPQAYGWMVPVKRSIMSGPPHAPA